MGISNFFITFALLLNEQITKIMGTKKMTKAEMKKKRWAETIERLRNTPPEKLSKTAKWILKNEENRQEVWMDMRAVLK